MLNAPLRQTLPTPPPSRAPSPSLLAAAAKAAAAPPSAQPPTVAAAAAPLVQPKLEKPSTPAPSASSASTSSSANGSAAAPPQPHPGCGVTGCVGCETCDTRPVLDTRALAEASRNLTQTLKQLSSEVLTSRSTNVCVASLDNLFILLCPALICFFFLLLLLWRQQESSGRSRRRQGAIIESMHHHGKGVYSGTFSGKMNKTNQRKGLEKGKREREISFVTAEFSTFL